MDDRDCEHSFAEAITGRVVLPWVNVNAAPDEGPTMTYGRSYRCVHCARSIHLWPLRFNVARTGGGLVQDWDS